MEKENRRLNPLYGIGVFVLVILVSLSVFAPIQGRLGMYGLAITELMLLGIAVLAAVVFRQDLKEVFPVKKPAMRQIGGTLLIWLGTYLAVLAVTMVLAYFFPEEILGVSQGLGAVLQSVPVWLTFLIAAVMPAICEEAVHRGFILSTFGRINNKWIVIVSMGAIFGAFHLDIYRFLPTAILGGALTYVMVKTKNMLLPMLFHLVNNTPAAFSSMLTSSNPRLEEAAAALEHIPLAGVGVYMILATAVPFLLLFGSSLLQKKEERAAQPRAERRKMENRRLAIAAVSSGALFAGGILIMMYGVLSDPLFMDYINKMHL